MPGLSARVFIKLLSCEGGDYWRGVLNRGITGFIFLIALIPGSRVDRLSSTIEGTKGTFAVSSKRAFKRGCFFKDNSLNTFMILVLKLS